MALLLVAGLLVAISAPAPAAPPCARALSPPVPGKIVRPFNPAKGGGHFGVDLASPMAAPVRAPVSGTVTFAGKVAGMLSVTIAPSPRVRVSLSFLSRIWVTTGRKVRTGDLLGRTGSDHGVGAVHLSLRVDGRYIDPRPALACGAYPPSTRWGLRLLPAR